MKRTPTADSQTIFWKQKWGRLDEWNGRCWFAIVFTHSLEYMSIRYLIQIIWANHNSEFEGQQTHNKFGATNPQTAQFLYKSWFAGKKSRHESEKQCSKFHGHVCTNQNATPNPNGVLWMVFVHFPPVTAQVHSRLWNDEWGRVQSTEREENGGCGVGDVVCRVLNGICGA